MAVAVAEGAAPVARQRRRARTAGLYPSWFYLPAAIIFAVLFMLPTVSPVTAVSFNYTPVAVSVVLGFAGLWWLVSARHWFTGPKVHGTPGEPAALEAELENR